ncbi:hypothetical protein BCR33DRAFT_715531 [Rhizoclosmatium globosum]|uniref:RNI-like protein n=1 Tax=Rhizoclosmatium globosum TaxID=329046 RepID=A0A1Y2CHH0_9FUNG|nr:hypothetical protein BCR33DRAFT_715531 [Rhizoclosmatium globosum]|eukprot:ORY46452.1 hypothetical protein BCR33DRAFT_715531 [Rhizoclosmatium globosum]
MDIPQQSLHRLDGFSTSLASINCTCRRNHNAVHRLPSNCYFKLWLTYLCFVNRAFYRVASSLLWQQPQFVTLHSFETFASLCGKQAPASHELRRLILSTTSSSNSAPRDLVHIDLTGCHHVTDAALAQLLVVSAPSLQILILTGCLNGSPLNDATLIELGKTCASFIECLDLSNCPRITDRDNDALDTEDAGLIIQAKIDSNTGTGRLSEFRFSGSQSTSRKLTWFDLERILECVMKGNRIQCLEFSIPPPTKNAPKKLYKTLPIQLFTKITSLHIHNAENMHSEVSIKLPHHWEFAGSSDSDTNISTTDQTLTLLLAPDQSQIPRLVTLKIDTALLHHLIHGCDCAQTIETLNIGHTRTLTDLSLFPLCLLPPNQTLLLSTTKSPSHYQTSILIPRTMNGGLRVLPEFVGVDSGSSEREYVFSGDGGWVMRRDEAEENRDEDVETDVESDEESWEEDGKVSKGLNSGKVFLLKDARYAEVLRRKRLVCIAKYGKTVLGDEL